MESAHLETTSRGHGSGRAEACACANPSPRSVVGASYTAHELGTRSRAPGTASKTSPPGVADLAAHTFHDFTSGVESVNAASRRPRSSAHVTTRDPRVPREDDGLPLSAPRGSRIIISRALGAAHSLSMCGPSAAGADVLLCVQHVWQGVAAPWSTVTAAAPEAWRSAWSRGFEPKRFGSSKRSIRRVQAQRPTLHAAC